MVGRKQLLLAKLLKNIQISSSFFFFQNSSRNLQEIRKKSPRPLNLYALYQYLIQVLSLKKRLNEIYSKHTGKSVDEIKTALERDNFMTSESAKSFGLIDQVVEKRS